MTKPYDPEFELECLSTIENLVYLINLDAEDPTLVKFYARQLGEITELLSRRLESEDSFERAA